MDLDRHAAEGDAVEGERPGHLPLQDGLHLASDDVLLDEGADKGPQVRENPVDAGRILPCRGRQRRHRVQQERRQPPELAHKAGRQAPSTGLEGHVPLGAAVIPSARSAVLPLGAVGRRPPAAYGCPDAGVALDPRARVGPAVELRQAAAERRRGQGPDDTKGPRGPAQPGDGAVQSGGRERGRHRDRLPGGARAAEADAPRGERHGSQEEVPERSAPGGHEPRGGRLRQWQQQEREAKHRAQELQRPRLVPSRGIAEGAPDQGRRCQRQDRALRHPRREGSEVAAGLAQAHGDGHERPEPGGLRGVAGEAQRVRA
mmetsp:Transcript_29140/g.90816  ORF Transcript_29140/g.90816 Transcript_29140/m.90816 type:complete len:316 (+) Transcript_29140:1811-2758(+)